MEILGIVNITEDSFSDGGRYLDGTLALEQAVKLQSQGAHVLDLGAASSHPDSKQVSPELEIERLSPVIDALHQKGFSVSVDSYQSAVQLFAIQKGVDYLNDIQGFADPGIYDDLAAYEGELILMHSVQQSGPADRTDVSPNEIMERLYSFFTERLDALSKAGVDRERIILDPGMGFFLGTNPETSLTVLRNTSALRAQFNLPVLISVSRKSFLGNITGKGIPERGPSTLAAEIFACAQGADYIRTHDVGQLTDAWKVWESLGE